MDICVLDPSLGGYVAVGSEQHLQQQQDRESSRSTSPASSNNDDVFSVVSDTSSQSSHGDVHEEQVLPHDESLKAREDSILSESTFDALPACQLQHPRRSLSATKRVPPPLPRQEQRKVLFVNDLVDSATNLVSVIWPMSSLPCGQSNGNKGILPLRRYIEETLRRSRTSYSTLQVALYYLILIKSHVPRSEFTMEQMSDCASMRAMQCGRRMFLAALILASKYLQDRNYSAKAWSKMSGLKTTEINGNERMFLSAVSWKLHIPDFIFKRWTDIVLQFTAQPSSPSVSSGITAMDSKTVWAQLIPLLTPTLDDPRILALPTKTRPQSLYLGMPSPAPSIVGAEMSAPISIPSTPVYQDLTPTPATITPRFLEPKPDIFPPTPGLVRMGPLATPAMTPSSMAANTPAVSTCSSRRPSVSMPQGQTQYNTFTRPSVERFSVESVRSSHAIKPFQPFAYACSSPESMISDLTRSSRSSSISSVSTASIAAPPRAFARPAISRSNSSNLTINPSKLMKDFSASDVITIADDSEMIDLSTPTSNTTNYAAMTAVAVPQAESRKRCHAQLSGDDDDCQLQNGVRSLLLRPQQALSSALELDALVAKPTVQPCAVRRAMAGLSRSSSLRAPQPTSVSQPLRRAVTTCQRSAVARTESSPRKRVKECREQSQVPDLFMEVTSGVWQGVA